jgi:hypothetical protein
MAIQPNQPTWPSAHDPDTGQRWQADFILPPNRLIATVTVTTVDSSGSPLATDLVITDVESAADTTPGLTKNLWHVSFFATGGDAGTTYLIQFRITLDGDTIPLADRTFRLPCGET